MADPFKILLIDDDEDDREFFMIALEDLPFKAECMVALGAKEAYEILETSEELPHIIFLDLNMPIIYGRACMLELKKKPSVEHIPVVIFSTSNEQRDIADTRKLGASDFMTKPTDLTKLTAYLNDLLVNQSKNQNKQHEK